MENLEYKQPYEVDRTGKAAFSAYLSLRRALQALERVLASGAPVDADMADARDGRLATAARSLALAAERYAPADPLVAIPPETLDDEGIAGLVAGIRGVLDGMEARGLAREPDTVRYLPDGERDTATLRAALALLAAAAPSFHEEFPGITVGVFGSVARGEDTPGSDLDLLIDAPDSLPLTVETRAIAFLGETLAPLGREADAVLRSDLRPEYQRAALAELVPAI